jgi:hypothetical protein
VVLTVMMGLCCVVHVAVVTVACLQLWAGLSLYVRTKHTHHCENSNFNGQRFKRAVANDCQQTIQIAC